MVVFRAILEFGSAVDLLEVDILFAPFEQLVPFGRGVHEVQVLHGRNNVFGVGADAPGHRCNRVGSGEVRPAQYNRHILSAEGRFLNIRTGFIVGDVGHQRTCFDTGISRSGIGQVGRIDTAVVVQVTHA